MSSIRRKGSNDDFNIVELLRDDLLIGLYNAGMDAYNRVQQNFSKEQILQINTSGDLQDLLGQDSQNIFILDGQRITQTQPPRANRTQTTTVLPPSLSMRGGKKTTCSVSSQSTSNELSYNAIPASLIPQNQPSVSSQSTSNEWSYNDIPASLIPQNQPTSVTSQIGTSQPFGSNVQNPNSQHTSSTQSTHFGQDDKILNAPIPTSALDILRRKSPHSQKYPKSSSGIPPPDQEFYSTHTLPTGSLLPPPPPPPPHSRQYPISSSGISPLDQQVYSTQDTTPSHSWGNSIPSDFNDLLTTSTVSTPQSNNTINPNQFLDAIGDGFPIQGPVGDEDSVYYKLINAIDKLTEKRLNN